MWRKAFPPRVEVPPDMDWRSVADRFELSGAGIMYVTQYCALEVLADKSLYLDLKLLEAAILREYVKDGKVV